MHEAFPQRFWETTSPSQSPTPQIQTHQSNHASLNKQTDCEQQDHKERQELLDLECVHTVQAQLPLQTHTKLDPRELRAALTLLKGSKTNLNQEALNSLRALLTLVASEGPPQSQQDEIITLLCAMRSKRVTSQPKLFAEKMRRGLLHRQLAHKIAQGEPQAWGELWLSLDTHLKPTLRRAARKMCEEGASIEETWVDEALEHGLSKLRERLLDGRFIMKRAHDPVMKYVERCAHNKLKYLHQGAWAEQAKTDYIDASEACAARVVAQQHQTQLEQAQEQAQLEETQERLSPLYRTLQEMRAHGKRKRGAEVLIQRLAGVSYSEIASTMNLRKDSVRKLNGRAQLWLQEQCLIQEDLHNIVDHVGHGDRSLGALTITLRLLRQRLRAGSFAVVSRLIAPLGLPEAQQLALQRLITLCATLEDEFRAAPALWRTCLFEVQSQLSDKARQLSAFLLGQHLCEARRSYATPGEVSHYEWSASFCEEATQLLLQLRARVTRRISALVRRRELPQRLWRTARVVRPRATHVKQRWVVPNRPPSPPSRPLQGRAGPDRKTRGAPERAWVRPPPKERSDG